MRSILILLTVSTSALIAGCGGGGGPSPSTPTARSFASIDVPAGFTFNNFHSTKTVLGTDVVDDSTRTATPGNVSVKVWYLDASGTRQTLLSTTLDQFGPGGSPGIKISNIPLAVTSLQAQSYFCPSPCSPGTVATTSAVLSIVL